MNLLDKILSVKASNITRLTAADVAHLDKLHNDYRQVSADHDIWEMVLRSKLEERFKGHYEWKSTRWRNKFLSPVIDIEGMDNTFAGKFFQPTDAYDSLMDERAELIDCYRDAILEYFNDTYELDLRMSDSDPVRDAFTKTPGAAHIVDWIFSKVSVASLSEYATHKAMETFRTNVLDTTITLEKNRLNFKRFQPFGYGGVGSDRRRTEAFVKCLGLFETGSLTEMYGTLPTGGYVSHYEPYQMNGSKIEAIKFFKNNKGIIYFTDAAAANEFISFFSVQISDK